MGLKVTAVKLSNEFNSIQTSWLKHLIGEKIPFEIDFEIETLAQAWTDNVLEYAPDSYTHKNVLQFESTLLDKFYEGDTIRITDPSTSNDGNYIIKTKFDNRTISVYEDDGVTEPVFSNATSDDATLTVIDEVDKIKLNHNFIENAEAINFFSKVTGTLQELSAKDLDAQVTTPVDMTFEGNKYWQIGDVAVAGVSLTDSGVNYISKFKITGNLWLTPFFLSEQWDDLNDDKAPDYFLDFNALKFVYRIEASYYGRSPQYCQFYQEESVLGDSGWFDEKFNNKPTNYSVYSLAIDQSGAKTAIPLNTTDTDIEIVIKNTTDDPFAADQVFVLNVCICPETEDEYNDNDVKNNYLAYNFRFDRAKNTIGSASVDGEQLAVTDRQILKDVAATLDSAEQITITAVVALGSGLVTYLKTLANPRYLIWVTTGLKDVPPQKDFQDGDSFEFQDAVVYDFQE